MFKPHPFCKNGDEDVVRLSHLLVSLLTRPFGCLEAFVREETHLVRQVDGAVLCCPRGVDKAGSIIEDFLDGRELLTQRTHNETLRQLVAILILQAVDRCASIVGQKELVTITSRQTCPSQESAVEQYADEADGTDIVAGPRQRHVTFGDSLRLVRYAVYKEVDRSRIFNLHSLPNEFIKLSTIMLLAKRINEVKSSTIDEMRMHKNTT